MAFTDHKLKFTIDADGKAARKELVDIDNLIGKVGGGLGSWAGPAAIAATGIAAVGVAAVATTAALFNLTKQASDYGSTIFDASKKTGLAAETLSAMDFAAKQSGTSLEQVTGGVAKFAKTVGEAADGSDKAAAKLKDFGISPQEAINDLDGGLGKVFKKIIDAPPGIERMTLAQKAFGKSGADLLPFLDSFDGDLSALTKKAKELGVTIDDEAARAADEFGDQLDTLNAQFAGIGRTIGGELMPVFLDLAQGLSNFLVQNREAISTFGTTTADVIRGVIVTMQQFDDATRQATNSSIASWAQWAISVQASIDPVANHLARLLNYFRQVGAASRGLQGYASGEVSPLLGMMSGSGGGVSRGGGGGGGRSSAASNADRAQREAERQQREYEAAVKKAANEAISNERLTSAERLAIRESEYERMYSVAQLWADEEGRTAEGLAQYREYLDEQLLENRKDLLNEYIAFLKEAGPEAVDELRGAEQDLQILENQIETERNVHAANEKERKKKQIEDEQKLREVRNKSWSEYVKAIGAAADAQDEADAKAGRARYESGTVMGGTGIGGAIGQGMGVELVPMFDEATNSMLSFQERLAMVGADINNFVGTAIGGLIEGLGAMGAAWLVTGEFSAKAALQMAAGAALGIAMQAGVKAIFEFAEAAAAYARFDPVSGAAHTAAAMLYIKTAAIAGAIGVGLGLAGRAVGGGKGGGGASASSGGGGRATERDTTPISRVSNDAYISGRRTDPATLVLAKAVDKLEKKISGMKPGDVLVAGSRQKRGFIGNQAAEDVKSNASIGVKLGRSMGMR